MPKGKRAGRPTKRAFVLSLPIDMPAKEVVEKARQAGIRLRDKYVYIIRSNAKHNGSTHQRTQPSVDSREAQFRRLAIELGLEKSKDLLKQTEQKIADVINGK